MKKNVISMFFLCIMVYVLASCQATQPNTSLASETPQKHKGKTGTPTAKLEKTPTPTATQGPTQTLTSYTPTAISGTAQVSSKDGMVMVYVPEGSFKMGNDNGANNEKPVRTIYLDAFWIDSVEVTNSMFAKFLEQAGYKTDAEKQGFDKPVNALSALDASPVVKVSWNDAQAYCKWAGRKLPTEAQWEKAARGTDGRKYPWGDQEPTCNLANYGGCINPSETEVSDTSPYGALNMVSKAWEWTADWYGYYGKSQSKNPSGALSGVNRVVRGGSWNPNDHTVQVTFRSSAPPDQWNYFLGFRCAVSP